MNFLNLFKKNEPKIKGQIGYYLLTDWWNNNLSMLDKEIILQSYKPMGGGKGILLEEDLTFSNQSAVGFLTNLAGWIKDKDLKSKILDKAISLIPGTNKILEIHFLYSEIIKHYWSIRGEKDSLDKVIKACENQIDISEEVKTAFLSEFGEPLPGHLGFEQLITIREINKEYPEALKLSDKALQAGWKGNFKVISEKLNKNI